VCVCVCVCVCVNERKREGERERESERARERDRLYFSIFCGGGYFIGSGGYTEIDNRALIEP
jgi:hypothetical protein